MQAYDLTLALGVHRHGDYGRHRDDPAALALLEVVASSHRYGQPPVSRRSAAGQRAVEEGIHALIDVAAQLGDGALADPR